MNPPRALALLSVAALLSPQTHAGRPLQTEDAGVIEGGGIEIEGVHSRRRDADASARSSTLTFNGGVGFSTQLGIGAARDRGQGESSGGYAFGGKSQVWRGSGDGAPSFALAWRVGYERQGGTTRHSDDQILAVASVPVLEGTLHVNLGHARDHFANRHRTLWAAAYELEGIDVGALKLEPMAEVFGDDGGTHLWNVALRLTLVPEKVFIDGSYGRQPGAGGARLVTVGFKIAF